MAFFVQQEQIREHLRSRGFNFCDDDFQLARREEGNATDLGEDLPLLAVEASSCDHNAQTIENTLEDDGERFWSSTGDASDKCCEYLLYQLKTKCSSVRAFAISVYRAAYQYGSPIYPPKGISFSLGMHPGHLQRLPQEWPINPVSHFQEICLPSDVPPASFIKVHLIGRQQRQLVDMKYYLAIKHVYAKGFTLSALQMRDLKAQRMLPHRRSEHCLLGSQVNHWCGWDIPGNSEQREEASAFSNSRKGVVTHNSDAESSEAEQGQQINEGTFVWHFDPLPEDA